VPNTTVTNPLAVLLRPPVTLLNSPLAVFWSPPMTLANWPLAVLPLPPVTLVSRCTKLGDWRAVARRGSLVF
jgi:hypothetical protein